MVHVRLRPLVADDARALLSVLGDPEMYRWVDDEPPTSLEYLRKRLSRWARRRSPDRTALWLNWAVMVDRTVSAVPDAGLTAVRNSGAGASAPPPGLPGAKEATPPPPVVSSAGPESAGPGSAEGDRRISELAGYVQATIPINGWAPSGEPAEIGYMIGRPWWGRTIGSHAVSLLLDELRLRWSVESVEALVDPRNCASVALLTGRGMSLLGQYGTTLHGQPAPEARYGMPLVPPVPAKPVPAAPRRRG